MIVLCIGNDLRRDDGAGPAAGRKLAALDLADISVHAAFQILPEHAELIAGHDVCIFVDASRGASAVTLRRIAAEAGRAELHALSFPALLAMARALFGAVPEGWQCEIPGFDFTHGEELSDRTSLAVDEAVEMIMAFHQERGGRRSIPNT
ncbi:MAG: hydrogenase maturation protease [Ignavibacteria bacterium]|nr:hydrogenase maturation protease [Ignavibacteria bacterium]